MQIHMKSKPKLPVFRSANGVGIKLQCAAQRGIDPEEILEGTSLKGVALDDPEIFITAAQELAILRKVLERIDDPQFGLFVGRHHNAAVLGKWAIAAIYSDTVLEALQVAMRYAELSLTYFQFELKTHGDKAFMVMHELMDLGKCRRFIHECQLRAIFQLCTEVLGGPPVWQELRFAFAKPDYAGVYQTIFNCPVSFSAEATMVVFDSQYLDLALPKSNPLTRRLYEKECEQLLQDLSALETTRDMVHRELMFKHERFPTINHVAQRLHMSSRTLRRRLQAEGASFKGLAEAVRRIKALDLLQTSGLTLERIAEQLGYSDVPNFCHAFKRWTGRTPSSFRASPQV